jgi:uncharacterized protein with ATP-grasp and redox domains
MFTPEEAMQTSVDCIPCFVRQALDTARACSKEPTAHEWLVRDVLRLLSELGLDRSPPVIVQMIHRRLRKLTGVEDPYAADKERFDLMAEELLPGYARKVAAVDDPLGLAVRLAIAGNVIDLGAKTGLTEDDARRAIDGAAAEPIFGDLEAFRRRAEKAERILYLADNAGEVFFDRLLIERLPAGRVTLAVRGAPVINDATMTDACNAGLTEIAEVIDNGSDAPGTVLADCSADFVRRFREADLIIAKGQGNYETLCEEAGPLFFLFRVKCPAVAAQAGAPVGAHMLGGPPIAAGAPST